MNKTKLTLAVSGGIFGVAALVMAYFIWSAYAARTAALEGDDESEGLETCLAKAQTMSRKPVYPCAESVKAIDAKAAELAAWKTDALKLAARGDKAFPKTTPAAFKAFIVADAKRLAALPGAADGKIVKPAFDFGPFKDYITGGKMPADDKLAEFQRKWDDVATVVEFLSQAGVAELTGIAFKDAAAEQADQAADDRSRRKARAKQQAKPRKGAPEAEEKQPSAFTYVFTLESRAPGFVKAVNALSTAERFIVVDDFSVAQGQGRDAISDALGGDEKKSSQQASSRRSRRGRRGAAQEEPTAQADALAKSGVVTDPLLDAPKVITLTLSVYDFHSLEEEDSEEKKGATK